MTKSDRNIDFLISSWLEIKKTSMDKLFINPPYDLLTKHKENHIYLRNKGDKKN